MNKVLLKNQSGESAIANILRYFEFNGSSYLVYSLNEIDESNYIKLYAIRVFNDSSNELSATTVEDSNWPEVVGLIKNIVNAKSENRDFQVNDLDSNSLVSINLISKRVFKINKDMANLLVYNKENNEIENNNQGTNSIEESNISSNIQNSTENVQQVEENSENYKDLYEAQIQINNDLRKQVEELKLKISSIENILRG